MAYLSWLAHELVGVVRANRFWMTWNLVLAMIPAVLAAGLFRRGGGRRGLLWWVGVGVFVLFLPNAPYVVTDLVHLRGDVAGAESDAVVVVGILPMYAAFVALGFSAYAFAVARIEREAERIDRRLQPHLVAPVVHLASAVGIVLGRMARLNSWDTVTTPLGTLESSFATLTWRGAPVAVAAVFVAVWFCHIVTVVIWRALGTWGQRSATRLSSWI